MIYRKILHILLQLFAASVFFASLTSCIFMAIEINYVGFWGTLPAAFYAFNSSLIIFFAVIFILHFIVPYCMKWKNKIFNTLLKITFINIYLIFFLVEQTFENKNGLWIYKHYFNYQNFSQTDFYFFHPYVGIIGIYISVFSYFFYRFLSRMQENPSFIKYCLKLCTFIPLILYFMIIYLQDLIPKPSRFIG